MDRKMKKELEGWAGLIGAFLFLGSGLVLAYQMYLWLKIGDWVPIPLSKFFSWIGLDLQNIIVGITWLGLRQIVEWLLDVSFSIWCLVLAFTVLYLIDSNSSIKRES